LIDISGWLPGKHGIAGAAVDEPASDALRAARRAARSGGEPFFDRGPGYAMLAGQPSAAIDQPDWVG